MKLEQQELYFTREIVEAGLSAGWDCAAITGRDHLTKVVGTTETMVLCKEQNGKPLLVPYSRITDLHPDEVAA